MDYIHTPKGILFVGDSVKIKTKTYNANTKTHSINVNPNYLKVVKIEENGFITAIGVHQPSWVFKGGAIVEIINNQEEQKMTKTIVSLAKEVSEALETRTRNDGSECVCFKNGSPEWMTRNFAQAAHGDMLPDDTRYRLIEKVLGGMAGLDEDTNLENVFHLLAEGSTFEPDVYNADLLRWLSSNFTRAGYVDEATETFGHSNLYTEVGYGQVVELEEIAHLIIDFFTDMLD